MFQYGTVAVTKPIRLIQPPPLLSFPCRKAAPQIQLGGLRDRFKLPSSTEEVKFQMWCECVRFQS